MALRHCAVQAIKGATIFDQNVADSTFAALDMTADGTLTTNEDRPWIAVYTDEGRAGGADVRSLRQNGALDFVVEFGIASAMTYIDPDTGASVIQGVNIPATDAAMELALDVVDAQIVAALTADTPWADVWRDISDGVTQIDRRRTAGADNGMRLAARQMRVTLKCKPDPVRGQPLASTSVWARFRALVDGTPLAATVDTIIGTPGAAVTWQQIMASRGMTEAAISALGQNRPIYTIQRAEFVSPAN